MSKMNPSPQKPGGILRYIVIGIIFVAGISLGWILKSLMDSRNNLAFISPTPSTAPILNATGNTPNPEASLTKTPELQKLWTPTSTQAASSNNPIASNTPTIEQVVPTGPIITPTNISTQNYGPTSNLPVPAEGFATLWDNPNPDLYFEISRIEGVEALISFTQTASKTEIILVTSQKTAEGQLADSYQIISTLSNWVLQMGNLIQQRPINLTTYDSLDATISCRSETSYADLLKVAQGELDASSWQAVSNATCG
jgi:hypothetical protein